MDNLLLVSFYHIWGIVSSFSVLVREGLKLKI